MSKQEYTKGQIQELLSNPNVKTCSPKYITYTDNFKLKALELSKRGYISSEIFKEFGFPNFVVNSKIPKQTLGRLRLQKKNNGNSGVISNKKGRKKKEKIDFNKMTLKEQNEYLKAKVAYLEELKRLVDGNYP